MNGTWKYYADDLKENDDIIAVVIICFDEKNIYINVCREKTWWITLNYPLPEHLSNSTLISEYIHILKCHIYEWHIYKPFLSIHILKQLNIC